MSRHSIARILANNAPLSYAPSGDVAQTSAAPNTADGLNTAQTERAVLITVGVLSAASAGVSGYHGYKRNRNSIGWAAAWGASGVLFPIITPVVAVAQGYAKPAK